MKGGARPKDFDPKKSHISIIIPTHNSSGTINRCISSLNNQTYQRENFEIIIVDDGSLDDSVNISKNTGADKIICIEPCFQGKARNIGVKNSNADLIAFIDSDCEAKKDWLKIIINELKNFEAITGPINNGIPQSAIACAQHFLEFGEHHKFRKKSQVKFLPGCNQAFRKKTFKITDGFVEFPASEDILLGKSLKKNKVKTFFIPNMQIFHYGKTNHTDFCSHMNIIGKYSVITRKNNPGLSYRWVLTRRYFLPILFIGKISKSLIHACHAKNLRKAFFVFPFLVSGTLSFCQGVFKELNQ